ncbi:MAG: 4a-hydroxytetrahydrobiopterin dehydratase [Candidatus Wallbacteria bacterium]|nr:4a-hydroxytetrahydrobiopterin dehydratase [Candidatus Wallbacteria bacterium]
MENRDLASAKCVPCHGGVPALGEAAVRELALQTPGWDVGVVPSRLSRTFGFKDFVEAMAFVNRVAAVAEEQGHHPDIEIHWNQVKLVLWTHSIGGLHENDFVVAARISRLL